MAHALIELLLEVLNLARSHGTSEIRDNDEIQRNKDRI
jgi:hypothetical protein